MSAFIETLLPVRVPPVALESLAPLSPTKILILPDLHLPAGPQQRELLLSSRAFLDAHQWVMLLGDMTAYYGTDGEYDHVRAFIDELDRPYGVVNGNHEFFFLPATEGSTEYGHRWQAGSPDVQKVQLQRFEQFYQIDSRFSVSHCNGVGVCTLGLDGIGPDDEGLLTAEHEQWLADTLAEYADRPMLFFCHFPLCDDLLDSIRYYKAGRKPYMTLNPQLRAQLRERTKPTFWFSGHVHFRPSHRLAKPYMTRDNVWQVHCPDARGYGRADNESWSPAHYEGLYVRSVTIEPGRVTVATTDLANDREVFREAFSLGRC